MPSLMLVAFLQLAQPKVSPALDLINRVQLLIYVSAFARTSFNVQRLTPPYARPGNKPTQG